MVHVLALHVSIPREKADSTMLGGPLSSLPSRRATINQNVLPPIPWHGGTGYGRIIYVGRKEIKHLFTVNVTKYSIPDSLSSDFNLRHSHVSLRPIKPSHGCGKTDVAFAPEKGETGG
jgi:hypothetical protein